MGRSASQIRTLRSTGVTLPALSPAHCIKKEILTCRVLNNVNSPHDRGQSDLKVAKRLLKKYAGNAAA